MKTYLVHAGEFSDDFERVTLVDEEPLTFGGVGYLHGILRYQRIEKRVILLRGSA